ncbi:unnamed protein product, partial [Ceratitis capitata]
MQHEFRANASVNSCTTFGHVSNSVAATVTMRVDAGMHVHEFYENLTRKKKLSY